MDGSRRLPIWIGHAEASSIDSRLREERAVRPNTHDLAKRLIDGLGGDLLRVVVSDLEGGIYYARIVLQRSGQIVEIDARPSDAIAIALRTGAPVFVTEPLFARAREDAEQGERGSRI
jgi:bifunctional DNase/RNase